MVGFIYILESSNSSSLFFFSLVSLLLALDSTEMVHTVSQTVTQMAVELINIRLISVQQNVKTRFFFHVKTTTNKF